MGYMYDVEEEVEEAEEEELGHTETYANYMPAKCTSPSSPKYSYIGLVGVKSCERLFCTNLESSDCILLFV